MKKFIYVTCVNESDCLSKCSMFVLNDEVCVGIYWSVGWMLKVQEYLKLIRGIWGVVILR